MEQIGVHPSTISRELNMNTAKCGRTAGTYLATYAQRRTVQSHQLNPKFIKFDLAMKKKLINGCLLKSGARS